jgi:glycosyltransferase involved in cell wall biosynthesis
LPIRTAESRKMKIAWVTRSFLDYRIPVFAELDKLVHGGLHLFFSGDYVPARVTEKARQVLGSRAVALNCEWRIGPEDREFMANRNISIRFQPGLLGKVRSVNPTVIIGDGFFKWTLPALAYCLRYNIPLVICYERWAHTERAVQWYRTLYRKMVVRFTGAMCCNGLLSERYAGTLGMPEERITTGHMAADTLRLEMQARDVNYVSTIALRNQYKAEGILFIYAGRLIPRKGLEQLLEVWVEFERQSHSGTLLITGGGPLEKTLQEMVAQSGIKRVYFAGPIHYDDMALHYAAADIFIIPTLEDNWSLVVPEAMACGLPILCSRYNGCWPELVKEGVNGWVFDPLDPSDILRVLNAAKDAEPRLGEMGEHSREIVAAHSPEQAARSILSACEIAMDRDKITK